MSVSITFSHYHDAVNDFVLLCSHSLAHYFESSVYKKVRPQIKVNWPSKVKSVLERSFDSDMEKRPNIDFYYEVLREELTELRGGDNSELSDTFIHRRRSHTSLLQLLRLNNANE